MGRSISRSFSPQRFGPNWNKSLRINSSFLLRRSSSSSNIRRIPTTLPNASNERTRTRRSLSLPDPNGHSLKYRRSNEIDDGREEKSSFPPDTSNAVRLLDELNQRRTETRTDGIFIHLLCFARGSIRMRTRQRTILLLLLLHRRGGRRARDHFQRRSRRTGRRRTTRIDIDQRQSTGDSARTRPKKSLNRQRERERAREEPGDGDRVSLSH